MKTGVILIEFQFSVYENDKKKEKRSALNKLIIFYYANSTYGSFKRFGNQPSSVNHRLVCMTKQLHFNATKLISKKNSNNNSTNGISI